MDKEARAKLAREIADQVAYLLHQEYRFYQGKWWLFTLGKPARPLLPDEIVYARGRGLIPQPGERIS